MFKLGAKSLEKMKGVHPDLIKVVTLAISYSEVDFSVTEGLRELARQKELVAKGFSQTLASMHLLQADGWGHAIDVMATGDLNGDGTVDQQDKNLTWNKPLYWSIAKAMDRAAAETKVKIRWGGRFKNFFDGPHYELVG